MSSTRAPILYLPHSVSVTYHGPTDQKQCPVEMFEDTSPMRKEWLKLEDRIVGAKPKGLVVVSSYWVLDDEGVAVNEDSTNPPVYKYDIHDRKLQRELDGEFYNIRFTSHGDAAMLDCVKKALKDGNIPFQTKKRGLDNGVFGEFHALPKADHSPVQGHFWGEDGHSHCPSVALRRGGDRARRQARKGAVCCP